LDWLHADPAAWTRLADDAKQHAGIRQALQHWQKDADLAGIRDPAAVATLPGGEQKAYKQPWADVAVRLNSTALERKEPDKILAFLGREAFDCELEFVDGLADGHLIAYEKYAGHR
jgi:hypothetical protein